MTRLFEPSWYGMWESRVWIRQSRLIADVRWAPPGSDERHYNEWGLPFSSRAKQAPTRPEPRKVQNCIKSVTRLQSPKNANHRYIAQPASTVHISERCHGLPRRACETKCHTYMQSDGQGNTTLGIACRNNDVLEMVAITQPRS